jgi:plastocyanin
MNSLDSRFLNVGDCYAVSFKSVGQVRYILSMGTPLPSQAVSPGFLIDVRAKEDATAPTPYTVSIVQNNGVLVPAEGELSAHVGDIVLWHTSDPAIKGFAVAGRSPDGDFSNALLKSEAIYSHAFGTAGTFEWVDAVGSAVSGVIVVNPLSPTDDADTWLSSSSLTNGVGVEIRAAMATPAKIEIILGQTVLWKVWDGTGIAIVDKRLLPPGK